jgi:hypothetical protein
MTGAPDPWPSLRLADWKPTCETLHRYAQIVGKIRLGLAPPLNHWWHVPLYVTPRGLATSAIPYRGGSFELAFDLVAHDLVIATSAGDEKRLPLLPRSVAAFHAEVLALLRALGIEVHVWRMPVEIPDPIPFDEDERHASYDPAHAARFFRVLSSAAAVLEEFAGGFVGKQSPVHFFWGSFDLALTRFSGRRAPPRAGADRITLEAYSHEVMSVGFWPGTDGVIDAAFYAYAAPEPAGYREAPIPPPGRWDAKLSEFVLPYDDVRKAPSPRDEILAFCEAAYDAAADLGGWDRAALERAPRAAPPGPGAGAHAPEQPTP